LSTASP
jgi:hypothetical protein